MNWRGRHDVKAHTVHLNHKERVRSISITNPVQTSSTRELCARKLDLVPTSFSPYVTTIIYFFIFLFDFNADLDACNGRYGVYNNDKVTWFKMVGRWQKITTTAWFELPFTGWSSLVVYSLSSSSSSPIYADRERGCVLPIHCHCTKNTFGLKKKKPTRQNLSKTSIK